MSPVRILLWLTHVSLPIAGLWVLIAQPRLDHEFQHHGVHFWLILGAAAVSLALAVLLLRAARNHRDMRLILVSLVFQLNSGFLGLHALATPGIILSTPNVGFTAAVPVGLVLGGLAALASAVEYGPTARAHRYTEVLAALPITLMAIWALLSLTRVPPFDAVPDPAEVQGPLVAATFVGAACYLAAAARYAYLYFRQRGTVLLSVLTAFVLLAEALFAVGFGRSWRVSWWEWHVLLGVAFALIAISAHRSFRREGSTRGLFDSVTLRSTVAAIHRDYAHALEEMVAAMDRRASGGVDAAEPLGSVGQELARRFGLTERQLAVLQQSAQALGNEREQVRRLGALVAVGERASVIRGERELLAEIQRLAAAAFDRDIVRIGVLRQGRLHFEDGHPPNPAAVTFPLLVKGFRAGVLELTRTAAASAPIPEPARQSSPPSPSPAPPSTPPSADPGLPAAPLALAQPIPPIQRERMGFAWRPTPTPGTPAPPVPPTGPPPIAPATSAYLPTTPGPAAGRTVPPPVTPATSAQPPTAPGPAAGRTVPPPTTPATSAQPPTAPGPAAGSSQAAPPPRSSGSGTPARASGHGGVSGQAGPVPGFGVAGGERPGTASGFGGPPTGPGPAVRPAVALGAGEEAVARSFAAQTSTVLENARLYQQLDGLFRSYMSPAVATALIADPSQAGLGGEIHEVSVLMADLRGFTPFAERVGPEQVMRMLNTYYGVIVPEILAQGGTVVQFVGDAVMAIFNAPVRQPDHVLRAARAGLALQRAVQGVRDRVDIAHRDDWPMFRVGVNTGPAVVGNVGAAQMRNFTAIGDTTNLAARLESLAEPGTVVVGPLTRTRLGDRAVGRDRGAFDIKGKRDPVTVYELEALR
ncbi:adenylate/guanylate cyclase domain-containing protein [Nocardia uniformis]|uniref:Adenylate/guanylate cyclase domain-containing protein n=1 Tax=Nocardia uniformis TaxID=53432 RepID=A0A849C5Y1_9NOCA|nr:adenylate/guanylate cyclase domain-containing protein [Nocardia uniformis]NNH74094.1 adenylate/guanylate cyclase domain-containing protein [Nocardia uniformis]